LGEAAFDDGDRAVEGAGEDEAMGRVRAHRAAVWLQRSVALLQVGSWTVGLTTSRYWRLRGRVCAPGRTPWH